MYKNYFKEHLSDSEGNVLCGRKNVLAYTPGWEDLDLGPTAICKNCAKLDHYFQAKYILEDGEYRECDNDEKVYKDIHIC